MPNYYKKALAFSFFFSTLIGIHIFFTDYITQFVHGPNTKKQLEISFQNALEREYEMLILGNSRIYRGVNPDKIAIRSYNFAHDNDSFNQIYYKLKYVLSKKDIKYLILGIDYFQFSLFSSSRNYIYCKMLPEDYCLDYPFDKKTMWLGLDRYFGVDKSITTLNSLATLFKDDNIKVPYLKANGQYIKHAKATIEDKIERDEKMLKIQEEYFNLILAECRKEGIKVFMIMPPTRGQELKFYSKSTIKFYNNFFNKAANKDVNYLNYSLAPNFDYTDFTDITHLNSNAADKFSKLINTDINKYIKSGASY